MRNILLLIILSALLIFSACDIIDAPYTEDGNNNPNIDTTSRKVVLEEFTGFRCQNCPQAHEEAKSIKQKFGDKVIILGIHSGNLAEPTPTHTYDFRTSVGNQLDSYFDVTNGFGMPSALINRKNFSTTGTKKILSRTEWLKAVTEEAKLTTHIDLSMDATYNEATRTISVDLEINYKANGSTDENFNIYIVEDKIIQYQLDVRKNPPHIYDYEHNSVLRGSMNGTFGTQVSTTAPTKGSTINKQLEYTLAVGSDWVPENIRLVAMVTNTKNGYEILQAEETKLIK